MSNVASNSSLIIHLTLKSSAFGVSKRLEGNILPNKHQDKSEPTAFSRFFLFILRRWNGQALVEKCPNWVAGQNWKLHGFRKGDSASIVLNAHWILSDLEIIFNETYGKDSLRLQNKVGVAYTVAWDVLLGLLVPKAELFLAKRVLSWQCALIQQF